MAIGEKLSGSIVVVSLIHQWKGRMMDCGDELKPASIEPSPFRRISLKLVAPP